MASHVAAPRQRRRQVEASRVFAARDAATFDEVDRGPGLVSSHLHFDKATRRRGGHDIDLAALNTVTASRDPIALEAQKTADVQRKF